MNRIRSKVTLLLLSVAAAGVLGTIIVTTDTFVEDKRNYVVEFNAIAAPNVAAAIGKHLDHLEHGLEVFDAILDRVQSLPRGSDLLKSAFSHLEGVEWLRIYDGKGIVASIGSGGDSGATLDPKVLERAASLEGRILLGRKDRRGLVLLSRVGSRVYASFLAEDVFREYFESARAISSQLVSEEGVVLDSAGESRNPSTEAEIIPNELVAAMTQPDRQALLVKEMFSPAEGRILVAIAPVPGTEGALVLVKAPATEAFEMAKQVLQSSLPITALIFGIAVFFGIVFTRQMVRPIETLTDVTSRIAKGHWSVPLPETSNDEIGRLVKAFSRMGQELQARETELNDTHKKLVKSERLAAIGTLSAGIAHEVKNPLNSILGFAQLAEKEAGESSKDLKQYVDFILKETRRASGIITDLLAYARQKSPSLESVSLELLVDQTIEIARPQAAQAGVTLKKAIDEPGLSAMIDRDQIYQVISNLVINSIHAMRDNPEGRARNVTLEVSRSESQVVISVIDTGTGIPAEILPKIFDPFFSTKKVGEGTGLGLAMCQQIVDAHDGKIEVESVVGEGTRFRVILRAS